MYSGELFMNGDVFVLLMFSCIFSFLLGRRRRSFRTVKQCQVFYTFILVDLLGRFEITLHLHFATDRDLLLVLFHLVRVTPSFHNRPLEPFLFLHQFPFLFLTFLPCILTEEIEQSHLKLCGGGGGRHCAVCHCKPIYGQCDSRDDEKSKCCWKFHPFCFCVAFCCWRVSWNGKMFLGSCVAGV